MRFSTRIGGWDLHEVHDGGFKLDGGAMFGVVPRALWQRQIPPDEAHRIPLALRCLLLRGHDRVALIDTGIGKKWSAKEQDIYAIDHEGCDLESELASLGVAPGDVTDVLLTHLHFDHAGGNTLRTPDGELVPAFPNATYRVPAANLAHAGEEEERDHVSYIRDNWLPIQDLGRLVPFEAGEELLPGVVPLDVEGHTPGMVVFRVQGPEGTLLYCADLVPTSCHVRLNYVMGYDLCARTSIREKNSVLAQAAEEDWVLFFEHDPFSPACRILRDDRGDYRVREQLEGLGWGGTEKR